MRVRCRARIVVVVRPSSRWEKPSTEPTNTAVACGPPWHLAPAVRRPIGSRP